MFPPIGPQSELIAFASFKSPSYFTEKNEQVHGNSETCLDFWRKIIMYADIFVAQTPKLPALLHDVPRHRGILHFTVKVGKQGVKVTWPNSNSNLVSARRR